MMPSRRSDMPSRRSTHDSSASAATDFDSDVRRVVLFRLDAFSYGIAAAWIAGRFPMFCETQRRRLLVLGVAVTLALGATLCVYDGTPHPALWLDRVMKTVFISAFDVAMAVIVIALAFVRRELPVAHTISSYAYVWYLWNLVVAMIIAPAPVTPMLKVVAFFAITWGVGRVIHRSIEKPIMHLRPAQH